MIDQALLFIGIKEKKVGNLFKTILFDLPNSAKFHADTLQQIFIKSFPTTQDSWMQKLSQINLLYIYNLLQDGNGANSVAKNISSFAWMKPYVKVHKEEWLRKCISKFAGKLVIETKKFEELDKKNKDANIIITEPELTENDSELESKVNGLGDLQWTIRCLKDYIVKIGKEKELQNSLGVVDLNYIKALDMTGKLCKELVGIQNNLMPDDSDSGITKESKQIVIQVNNTIQAIISNSDRTDKMTKATVALLSNLTKGVIEVQPDDKGTFSAPEDKK